MLYTLIHIFFLFPHCYPGAPGCGELTGDGAFAVSADYFNPLVACWEPVIERWSPDIMLTSDYFSGTTVEVISANTLQLNVSGSMTRQVMRVVQLMSSIRKGEETAKRDDYAVVFCNRLGFPVEIAENTSKEILLTLIDNTPTPLPSKLAEETTRACVRKVLLPAAFDVRPLGSLGDLRLPITSLPLNVNRARPYYLQPVGGASSTRGFVSEPIVEELYENERYQPLKLKWVKPWANFGDPNNFTDVNGKGNLDPSTIALPSDRWEWVEPRWTLDKSGKIGVETDEGHCIIFLRKNPLIVTLTKCLFRWLGIRNEVWGLLNVQNSTDVSAP